MANATKDKKTSSSKTKAKPKPKKSAPPSRAWNLKGELVLNCNCTVFCPCVISLGQHPPSNGYCQGWAAIEISEGTVAGENVSGLKMVLMLDIPGRMSEGNWSAALYVDEGTSEAVTEELLYIFSGQGKGSTRVLGFLVGNFLGVKTMPIDYQKEGMVRHISMGRALESTLKPVASTESDQGVVISNSQYWIGPEITVYQAENSKYRDFGRVWDLSGRSAEFVPIDWKGE